MQIPKSEIASKIFLHYDTKIPQPAENAAVAIMITHKIFLASVLTD
jgi:hypothetical protein